MIVLIDNYDSFVFNIKAMLELLSGDEIRIVRNDKISLEALKSLRPSHIILSPGPKHPKDSGICLEIFRARLEIPVLGICLGHQALGLSFGAKIRPLARPCHAESSTLTILERRAIFEDLPQNFKAMRYHSLEVVDLSPELEPLAFSEDGVLMAMGHKTLPYFGVQFHPESYFSEYGLKILSNFIQQKAPSKDERPSLSPYLHKLSEGRGLENEDFAQICERIMAKNYEPLQLAALLILITEKSLNDKSLSALVRNILRYSKTFSDESEMIDLCGTGGDGFKSINVSTASAFILASLGVCVAKHGNKAISSASGSSDVLEALGVKVAPNLEQGLKTLREKGLNFFHAPLFHPLLAELRELRTRLGVRTVFNVLGPLLHPNLKLKYQMMGNYHAPVHRLLAEVLRALGRKRALVVRGCDGMDELSICDESRVAELREGVIYEYNISPEQFGFKRAFHDEIAGGNPAQNAEDLRGILSGKIHGAKRDIVVLNAMFALYTADKAPSPQSARELVERALDEGRVWDYFRNFNGEA